MQLQYWIIKSHIYYVIFGVHTHVFPPNCSWFLNWFRSEFLKPWCDVGLHQFWTSGRRTVQNGSKQQDGWSHASFVLLLQIFVLIKKTKKTSMNQLLMMRKCRKLLGSRRMAVSILSIQPVFQLGITFCVLKLFLIQNLVYERGRNPLMSVKLHQYKY